MHTKGKISVRNLNVVFHTEDRKITALKELTFEIQPKELVCFLGTSGCGKSTALNVIAGFVKASSGDILLDDVPITEPGPDRGIIFQQFALFPWKTVEGNILFGSKLRGMQKQERKVLLEEYITMMGLDGFEKNYPPELSGGMQQRVAIARALANDPSILLMDEPFGSLDAQTRIMMQEVLLDIWQKTRKTIVFVTHDIDEAIFLADRIYVLTGRPGKLKKEILIKLPRPRSYEIVTSADYTEIKKEILELIHEEALKLIKVRT